MIEICNSNSQATSVGGLRTHNDMSVTLISHEFCSARDENWYMRDMKKTIAPHSTMPHQGVHTAATLEWGALLMLHRLTQRPCLPISEQSMQSAVIDAIQLNNHGPEVFRC